MPLLQLILGSFDVPNVYLGAAFQFNQLGHSLVTAVVVSVVVPVVAVAIGVCCCRACHESLPIILFYMRNC